MSSSVRAVRAATTLDRDEAGHLTERVVEMLEELFTRNDIGHDEIISVVFTATDDIHSMFPATAARTIGLGDVPLMCARELDIVNGTERCIRVMMHIETDRRRGDLHHVYLHDARSLRDDLPA